MAETAQLTLCPYGLWKSPISPGLLGQRIRLDDVQWDSDGQTLVWLEGRSDRGVLVAKKDGEARLDLVDEQNVRGGVGYGGGEFTIRDGVVVFADRSGRLYRRDLGYSAPRPITPLMGFAASPAISPDGNWVMYVYSDGKVDLIALVDSHGSEWPIQLARGADFYMQPCWSHDGKRVAWIEWDHPCMPWDGTRLVMADLAGTPPKIVKREILAGDVQTPVSQPQFSPDGQWISWLEASGEWEDLVLMNLASGDTQRLVKGSGFQLDRAAWVQGIRTYGWTSDSSRIFYLRETNGITTIWSVGLRSGISEPIVFSPYTFASQISVSSRGDVAVLAAAPGIPDRVLRWNGTQWLIEARSTGESVPPELYSIPKPFDWLSDDGALVHGLFFAPKSLTYQSEGLPPAIINVHGGPTGRVPVTFSAETAYFTSRGYAVLEVNYRGSPGYGRSYRDALRLRWGDLDVVDTVSGTKALVEKGQVDGKRLVVKGGSAGGYTVLNCLVRYPGFFKAGICLYGVSNLFTLAMDTHKFEERYTDSLVGPLPEAASRYHAWSPIYHANRIRDPMAVFQGSIDKVVTPDQSETVVKALREGGIPHIYRLYEGEGHGFRKTENIQDYYTQVERFLQQYVLFAGGG
ncbi:MAG TPA: prolyl oligopeptidase family serine peptidase [Anaerolineaceae bacterium]